MQVAIFRHNLFKLSEPFIAQQAQALRRYQPVYVGRLRYGAGPEGADTLALGDAARLPLLAAGWQMASGRAAPYMKILGDRRPALVHAHFGVEGVYALPLAARLRVPLVTTFHGFDATLSTAGLLSNPAWVRYALGRRRLAREGRLFLCASRFLREKLLGLGFPAARTRTHYIGIDVNAVAARAAGEEEPGLVLHVARLEEVKGTATLIAAFGLLAPGARLVIIGDGSLRAKLEAQARASGGRIEFLGAQPHDVVLGWMRRASLLAIPSVRTASGREEGLGMVMLEAAATGLPVVGSDVGGIPEGIADGETGFLVPARDAAALAARLRMLLDDADLRRRFGAAGRAKMQRDFDLARQSAALEDLYDEVLA